MSKAAFEKKLDDLRLLRADPQSASTIAALCKALRDRNNYIVSKAAAIAEEFGLRELTPDLVEAYGRFFADPMKSDPQCWAKNATAKALLALEFEGPEVWVRGIHYVQPEPSFGGTEDSATTLRSTCVLALAQCSRLPSFDILEMLTNAFVDQARPVRIEVARAIGLLGKAEGALLLRMKVLMGREDPEVIGACFSSLMHLQRSHGVGFVAGYLRDEDLRVEAAASLGDLREPEAFEALHAEWKRTRDRRFRQSLLIYMGASRQEAAVEFLLSLIDVGDLDQAGDAVVALEPNGFHQETRERLEKAVRRTGSEALLRVFRERFRQDR